MVAVVENRTAVVGVVRAVRPDGPDRVHLELEVEQTRAVGGMPDLLTAQHPAGSTCTVGAPAVDLPEGLAAGVRLTAQLRLAGPGVVALAVDPPPVVGPGPAAGAGPTNGPGPTADPEPTAAPHPARRTSRSRRGRGR